METVTKPATRRLDAAMLERNLAGALDLVFALSRLVKTLHPPDIEDYQKVFSI